MVHSFRLESDFNADISVHLKVESHTGKIAVKNTKASASERKIKILLNILSCLRIASVIMMPEV